MLLLMRIAFALKFESGSKLTRMETDALDECLSLTSILIPRSVLELRTDWTRGSCLRQVVFESVLSLRLMLEAGTVDLSQEFEIKFVEYDRKLDFTGYVVQTVHSVSDVIRLLRIF
jgi:hypothetical protein